LRFPPRFPKARAVFSEDPVTDAFQPRSDFMRVMQERRFIHQCSDLPGLDEKARSGSLAGYIGYDCTAPSLHVGNLVSIMMLHWLQESGGKPVALMGGGTTMVGDPSGKDESRKLLTVEAIEANKTSIRKAFSNFIRFGEGKLDAIMPDNADWLAKLNYIDFLRDIGRHFSVNRMLAMDSVKVRLEREQELSFLEFNYMCLQAYDFTELYKRYGVTLQMGGSDQWGNIVTGIDLGRRIGLEQFYALTSPLITAASGAKMGKTAAGAVWLDETMLSPYDYWQFWRNADDSDAGRFLRLFTLLPMDEIRRLENLPGAEINEAKKILANEATALLHGREAADAAAATARKTFEEGALAESLPTVEAPGAEFDEGLGVLTAFVRAGLVASTGEARRQIRGGGLRVNDAVLTDEKALITREALQAGGVVKLSLGRKKHVLLRAV
jgi:tyrosyl-tRNA synthetase